MTGYEIVSSALGLILAVATVVLARYTTVLSKVTGELVKVEKRNEERRRIDSHAEDLMELIFCVERIHNHKPDDILKRDSLRMEYRTLLRFLNYIKDTNTRELLKELNRLLDLANQGTTALGVNLLDASKRIRDRIQGDELQRWKEDLERFTRELQE